MDRLVYLAWPAPRPTCSARTCWRTTSPTPRRRLPRRAGRSAPCRCKASGAPARGLCARIDAGATTTRPGPSRPPAARWTWRCAATPGWRCRPGRHRGLHARRLAGGHRRRHAAHPRRAAGDGRRRADPAARQQRAEHRAGRNGRAKRQRAQHRGRPAQAGGTPEAPPNRGRPTACSAPPTAIWRPTPARGWWTARWRAATSARSRRWWR